jgi:hypothetical protein
LALGQAQTLIDYVEEQIGAQAMSALLSALGDRQPMAKTIESVFSQDADEVEANWLSWLRARYAPS